MIDHNSENTSEEQWAMRVQEISQRFDYPPTPDIAGTVRARLERRSVFQPARAAAIVLLAAVVLGLITVLAVPDWRAKAFDWLRIGAVQIVDEPTATTPDELVPLADDPLFDPAYAVTLADARAQVDFPIRVPSVLGEPDRVYLHLLREPMVILAWTETPTESPISLHIIAPGNFAVKYSAEQESRTSVNDQPAYWLVIPHPFTIETGDGRVLQRTVTGHVLIWESGELTYRLEGAATLDDARRIAESLR